MKGSCWLVATAAAVAVSVAGLAAKAEDVTLTAINFVPNNHAFGKPFADWVEKVNAGGGSVKIDLKASAGMSPFKMGDAIRDGAFDMANLPATFYQNLLPIGDALKLLDLAPKGPHEPDAAWSFFNEVHQERINMRYLTTWGWGIPFQAYFREGGPSPEKIRSLDWSGVKMRITPIYRAFFKGLGADVVQIPPPEVVTSLERGTVDGYGWPIWDINSPGWAEHTAYRLDPGFYSTTSAIVMNLGKWQSLSDAQREFLQNSAWEMAWDLYQTIDEQNAKWDAAMKEAGVEVIQLEGEAADEYIKTAYEAGWAEHMQLVPEDAKRLKEIADRN